MLDELMDLYKAIYKYTKQEYAVYLGTKVDVLLDPEFTPYRKNDVYTIFFYTVIKKYSAEFLKYKINYEVAGYGVNNGMKAPLLLNEKYIIMFFSSKNDLSSKFVSDTLSDNPNKMVVVIGYDFKDNGVSLYERTRNGDNWTSERIF